MTERLEKGKTKIGGVRLQVDMAKGKGKKGKGKFDTRRLGPLRQSSI